MALIGLAAVDVMGRVAAVALLLDCSEWPVLLANTFLRRSSSAFRSASYRHTPYTPHTRQYAVRSVVLCCVVWYGVVSVDLPLSVLDGVVEEECSERCCSIDV